MILSVEASLITTELAVVAEQASIPMERSQMLMTSFAPLYSEIQPLLDQAREINVIDPTQVTEMRQAGQLRRELKAVRCKVENLRKSLKESSIREGKAIEGMANVLKFIIEPAESRMEEIERFAERLEAERKANLKASREELLAPLGLDTEFYDLANMAESTFATLLKTTRLAHEARLAAAIKAEAERVAAERARIAEEARIRKENEKLRAAAIVAIKEAAA